ncbi:MAG: hypothetical protein OET79_13835, partial [Nitrospirota bacterium]|nr:hypothetical protein [Nitrospirota bacterium]
MRPAGNDRLDHPLTVAGISLGFWALLLVASRILLVRFGFDPWSFTFIQLIVSGGVLIVLSRGGNVDWRSLRRWSTWVYGALRVTTAATFTAALVHVPVVGAGLLGVMNVPMAALAVWLAFGRRARSSELPGHLCVLAGIVLVTMRLDGGFGSPAFLWVLLSQISVIGGALIAERHPDNNAAEPRARLRFTGVVLLLTALLFLIGRLLFGAGAAALADLVPALLDPALWLSGLAIGLLLRGPSMHLS